MRHKSEEKRQAGLLVAKERGISIEAAVEEVRTTMILNGIAHECICNAPLSPPFFGPRSSVPAAGLNTTPGAVPRELYTVQPKSRGYCYNGSA